MPVAFGGEHICSKLVEIRVFRGCDIMCSASGLREGVWRAFVTWSCGDWRYLRGLYQEMDSRRDC